MDNILEKFGIYDFFGLLLPGMIFSYALIYIKFPLIPMEENMDSIILKAVAFVLFSYICGIWMQEIGTLIDKNLLKIRKSARMMFLEPQKKASKLKKWFEIQYSFDGDELQKVKIIIDKIVEEDIDHIS